MAVLDTSFLVDLLRGKASVKLLKDELDKTEIRIAIAAPSITELWFGAHLAKQSTAEKAKINDLLSSLEILPLDNESAKEAGDIQAELLVKGLSIQPEDSMIAGIARINGEKVVTRDEDYVRIQNLKVLKY